MPQKKHKAEEIVAKLRQVDVLLSQGRTVGEAVRSIGVTQFTYYRWRKEFGGLKGDQVKRLKELEKENDRLRKAVSDLQMSLMLCSFISTFSGGPGAMYCAYRRVLLSDHSSGLRHATRGILFHYTNATGGRRREHADRCGERGYIVIGKDAANAVGRRYPLSRLPEGKSSYTVSCNFPVQGACADASMLALAAIDELLFEHGINGGPVAWLHDEIVLEVPIEHSATAKRLLVEAMERAFAETFPGAPLIGLVEANSGPNWSAAKEKKAV